MPKAGRAAASRSSQPPHCPAQPSPCRSSWEISSWLGLQHTWPLSGCQRRLPGLPARQTSRPWHQVGNCKARAVPEGIFSPPSPSATQMRGKSLSQLLPFSPKSSQRRGASQIMYFCAQCCLVQRFSPEHQPLSPWLHPALPGAALSSFASAFTSPQGTGSPKSNCKQLC